MEDLHRAPEELAADIKKNKRIMGQLDPGCMGMLNALINPTKLGQIGMPIELLNQSDLVAEMNLVSEREAQGHLFLTLKGFRDRTSVEKFRHAMLQVPESDLPPLPEGEYYRFQLIGLTVTDRDGNVLGTLDEVIETGANRSIPCEVIGFSGDNAVVMPFAGLEGVRRGCRAVIANAAGQVRPSPAWLGRVINAMGEPIDGKGPLPQGASPMPFRNTPPPAHSRQRVGAPLDLGVRALNTFITCCRGQRMGIFSGSGVGKSVLLSMLARNVNADVTVIGLIGERGREAQEFLQDDLGEAGLEGAVLGTECIDERRITGIVRDRLHLSSPCALPRGGRRLQETAW